MTIPLRLLAGFLASAAAVPAAADWALMAREGGCHPIASLLRRLPDLPEVRDPEAFERYLRTRGWTYARKTHAAGQAVEFVVDSQGLALVFATRELCASAAGREGGR